MAVNKDAYQCLCNHIQELNNFLTNATRSSLRIEVKKRQKGFASTKHSARLKRLREDARNIHLTVTNKACWKCACQHKVMLRMTPDLFRSSGIKQPEILPESWRLGVDEPRLANSWHLLKLHPLEHANKENQPPQPHVASQHSGPPDISHSKQYSQWHSGLDASSIPISQGKVKKKRAMENLQ